MACNFLYEFPQGLRDAILNNYLVNTSGLKGRWFELDLLQEHFNFWIKRLFNGKTKDFDAKHLAEAVSLNIQGFGTTRDRVPGLFGFRKSAGTHTSPDKANDINRLGTHFHDNKILQFVPKRDQPYLVKDEFGAGIDVLEDGQLRTFLDRTTRGMENLDLSDVNSTGNEMPDIPSNPIYMDDGTSTTLPFATH